MRYPLIICAGLVACAPAAEPPAASGPAALDSAAAAAVVDAFTAEYARHLVAGDAAAIAGLFTDDATGAYFSFPTATGRAAIEELYAASFKLAPRIAARIVTTSVNGSIPGLITGVGTNSETADSAGVSIIQHWRWAAVWRQGADGRWRFSYAMAFPDSVTRGK